MNVFSDQLEHHMWNHIVSNRHRQTFEKLKMHWETSATSLYLILCAKALRGVSTTSACGAARQLWFAFCSHSVELGFFYYAFNNNHTLVALIGKIYVYLQCHYWHPHTRCYYVVFNILKSCSWSFHLTHLVAQCAVLDRIMKLHLSGFIDLIVSSVSLY